MLPFRYDLQIEVMQGHLTSHELEEKQRSLEDSIIYRDRSEREDEFWVLKSEDFYQFARTDPAYAYRGMKQLLDEGKMPAAPGYKEFVNNRICLGAQKRINDTRDSYTYREHQEEPLGAASLFIKAAQDCENVNAAVTAQFTEEARRFQEIAIDRYIHTRDVRAELNNYKQMRGADPAKIAQWEAALVQHDRTFQIDLSRVRARAKAMICWEFARFLVLESQSEPVVAAATGLSADSPKLRKIMYQQAVADIVTSGGLKEMFFELSRNGNVSLEVSHAAASSEYQRLLFNEEYCAK